MNGPGNMNRGGLRGFGAMVAYEAVGKLQRMLGFTGSDVDNKYGLVTHMAFDSWCTRHGVSLQRGPKAALTSYIPHVKVADYFKASDLDDLDRAWQAYKAGDHGTPPSIDPVLPPVVPGTGASGETEGLSTLSWIGLLLLGGGLAYGAYYASKK